MKKSKKIENVGLKRTKSMVEKLVSLRNPEDRKLEVFSEAFEEQFNAFEKSPRAKIMGINDSSKLALGECLSNYLLESNDQSKLGLDPLLALNVITSVFGNSVMPLFTSEQALTDKQGVIYFENIVAKTTKGNVTAGQILAKGAGAKDVYPVGYAGEAIYGVKLGTGDGTAVTFSINFNTTNLRPSYIHIQAGDVVATDDGKGNLFGTGVHGTVNYAAGTGSITFATAPANNLVILGDCVQNFEVDGAAIPKINAEYDSRVVKVHTYALQADTSILANYITKQRLGMDANKRIVKVLQEQILREITNEGIAKIASACSADNLKLTQFNLSPREGISVQAHYNSYNLTHAKVQNKMATASGKGNFQTLLAGTEFCEFLTGLNEFKQEGIITDDPTFFGTLGGRYGDIKVVRCPQLPTADKNSAYAVYKGQEKTDAAAVFAPFMPVVVTNDVPVADNLLQRRSMIASMATTEVVVDRYLQKITLAGDPYTPAT